MKTQWLAVVVACGAMGCGSAVLKPPLNEGCKSSGLKGCEHITDGVIAFVEGKEEKGTRALVKAAAANSPAQMQAFIKVLKDLEKVPGTSDFMGPIMQVVAILEGKPPGKDGGSGVAAADSGHPGNGGGNTSGTKPGVTSDSPGGGAGAFRWPDRVSITTAADDIEQMRSGTVTPDSDPRVDVCGNLIPYGEGSAKCVTLRKGPFVLTDLSISSRCALFVAAGHEARGPDWVLHGHTAVHGARLLVKKGSVLVVGELADSPQGCSLTFSGFRPYADDEVGSGLWGQRD